MTDEPISHEPPDPSGGDEWDRIDLNEDFVAGARRSEATADERVARAKRVSAEHAALEKQGAISPYATLKRPRFRWLRHRATWLVPLVILILIALALWLAPIVARMFSAPTTPGWPKPGIGEHASRMHQAVYSADSTSFAFDHLQRNGVDPVAYDPCRVIDYVVNPVGAPSDGTQQIRAAVASLQHATGLQFAYQGTTTETFSTRRPAYQPWRYGTRWAPVLITWSLPTRDGLLKGDVIGDAGSAWVSIGDGARYYITGQVSLDGPQLNSLASVKGGASIVRAVLLHELGHLVGLAHTSDPSQVMFPHTSGALVDYQAGDRAGLARLGRGACSTSFYGSVGDSATGLQLSKTRVADVRTAPGGHDAFTPHPRIHPPFTSMP